MLRFYRPFSSLGKMASRPVKPLIAVVGATGTGKSDLAVDIARKFNGEIINSDAIQLYQGLPIITNKITQDEMKGVPHHLLGCIGLQEETWTVGKFVSNGLRVIDEIRSRGKLPVLVGGTHYYTQSLLFEDTLANEPSLDLEANSMSFPILQEATEVIHAKLKEFDPIMADRWHPNERRKIQRSLEIFLRIGKPASQVYDEQRRRKYQSPHASNGDTCGHAIGLRSPTLVLWVHANKDTLYPRLDGRVDKMLEKGLLKEVEELTNFKHEHEARTGTTIDQTRGIWVSIGYKEFLDYQHALTAATESEVNHEPLKATAIERTQAATRQYANRQIKWIRIKLLNALIEAGQQDKVFLLNGTDLSEWNDNVIQPATDITKRFLDGTDLPQPSSLSETASDMLKPKREYDLGKRPDLWEKKICETCGTVAVTENDWMLHVKSRAHRRAVGMKKKKQEASREISQKKKEGLQTDMVDVLESYMKGLSHEEGQN